MVGYRARRRNPSHHSSRLRRRLLVLPFISGVFALTTGVTLAASVQDQANLGPRIGEVLSTGATSFGQTFIAGITGPLTQVRLFGCNANNDLTSVQVALYPATGVAPNSTPDTALGALAIESLSGSRLSVIPPAADCGSYLPFDITFTSTATVTAGARYVLVISATATDPVLGGLTLQSSDQSTYLNGNRSRSLDSGATWTAVTTRNLLFATYVDDGTNTSLPPDILESFGLPTSGSCTPVPLEVRTNIAERETGWGRSWTQGAWLNNGRGGPVCVRTLRYSPTLQGYAAVQ